MPHAPGDGAIEGPLLIGVREAAAVLGIGRDTAYQLVRQGRLRSVSVGRKVLVPRSELSAFIEREATDHDDWRPDHGRI